MTNRTILRISALSVVALALIALFVVPGYTQFDKTAEKKKADDMMLQNCNAMVAEREKLVVEMTAQDAEVTAQISRMNSSSEKYKVDLLAAVVTRMMVNKTNFAEKMEKIHDDMLAHAALHGKMGESSMMHCPMMLGMYDRTEFGMSLKSKK